MPRAGATTQRSAGSADTGAHRLPIVHDEVAGTRRTLRLVFVLLVVMTGVAAFAVGGLITLRGDGSGSAVAPVGPEQIAAAVGRLATPAPSAPDPFDLLTPTTPAPGIIAPPIIGLTTAPDTSPTTATTAPPTGPQLPEASATAQSSCVPDASPTPEAPPAGGSSGADVPVVPLAPPCSG